MNKNSHYFGVKDGRGDLRSVRQLSSKGGFDLTQKITGPYNSWSELKVNKTVSKSTFHMATDANQGY